MRLWNALPLLLLGVILPAHAQRGGGGHGASGFAGHAGATFRGSARGVAPTGAHFGGSAARFGGQMPRFGGFSRYAAPRMGFGGPGARYNPRVYGGLRPGVSAARPTFYSRTQPTHSRNGNYGGNYGRDRNHFREGFGAYPGYGFALPVFNPYLGSFLDAFPYPFADDDDNSFFAEGNAAPLPGDAGVPYSEPPAPYTGYAPAWQPDAWASPQPPTVAPQPQADPPQPEDAITLIFQDGRPSEQVRNYALTRTTLLVVGRRIREIPLSELDLSATEGANRAAGIDFQLPQSR